MFLFFSEKSATEDIAAYEKENLLVAAHPNPLFCSIEQNSNSNKKFLYCTNKSSFVDLCNNTLISTISSSCFFGSALIRPSLENECKNIFQFVAKAFSNFYCEHEKLIYAMWRFGSCSIRTTITIFSLKSGAQNAIFFEGQKWKGWQGVKSQL